MLRFKDWPATDSPGKKGFARRLFGVRPGVYPLGVQALPFLTPLGAQFHRDLANVLPSSLRTCVLLYRQPVSTSALKPSARVPIYTHCPVACRLSHHAETWKPPRSQSSGVGRAGAEAASVTVGRGRPGGLRARWASESGSGNEGEDGRGQGITVSTVALIWWWWWWWWW